MLSPKQIENFLKLNTEESIKNLVDFLDQDGYGRSEAINFLVTKINNDKSVFMHWLALEGRVDLFQELLKKGASFSVSDANKNTPLHVATIKKQLEIMKIIMINDVDVKHKFYPESERKNNSDKTAFDLVMSREGKELLEEYTKEFWKSREIYINKSMMIESSLFSVGNGSNSYRNVSCDLPKSKWIIEPTGQIQWKDLSMNQDLKQNVSLARWGSGGLISDDLFLTAGHCLDSQKFKTKDDWYILHSGTDEALEPKEIAQYLTVNFNYQNPFCDESKNYSIKPQDYEIKFDVNSLIEHREGGLDYGIIKLDDSLKNIPVSKFGKMALSDRVPEIGETVVVAQHPNGEPKKIAEGKVVSNKNGKLVYYLDTQGGSSGSVVGDKNKTVVAVHTTGDKKPYITGNSGVTINAISKYSGKISSLLQQYGQFSTKEIHPKEKKLTEEKRYTLKKM